MSSALNTLSKLFPWIPEDSILLEILQEAHSLTPKEFTWPNEPVAEGEILLDVEITEYEKRLCAVLKRLTDEIQSLSDLLQLEKDCGLTPSERENIIASLMNKKYICGVLLCVNFLSMVPEGYSRIGIRVDHQIVAVLPST